jgi:hypothetical protein
VSFYEDEQPELVGYVPDDGRPLRSPHMLIATRVIVILALVALIVPEIVTQIMVVSNAAQASCKLWVRYEDPGAGHSATFQLFGQGGAGWQCYSVGGFGGGHYIAPLGLIPGTPIFPSQTTQ